MPMFNTVKSALFSALAAAKFHVVVKAVSGEVNLHRLDMLPHTWLAAPLACCSSILLPCRDQELICQDAINYSHIYLHTMPTHGYSADWLPTSSQPPVTRAEW